MLAGNTMPSLKYLFVASLTDGTAIIQTPEDQSQLKPFDPEAEHNVSAFYDVQQRIEDVNKFGLVSQEDGSIIEVDLTDGHFVINGYPFIAHDQFFLPQDHSLELIYYRETRVDFNPETGVSDHYINRYFLGWKTLDSDGKKVQHVIGIA
jgi:5-deoxy-D-glucuronate isomerase